MSETNLSSRNSCLDFVKGIACICVVFMHCEFPGTAGVVIQAVSRFCVPFFFMVSGYFCFSPVKTVNYTKKIKHIGIITLAAFCFYTVLAVLFGTGLKVTAGGIMNWIAFNSPVIIVGQMWFLFALLYDYIVFAAADRSGLTKAALFAIPVLMPFISSSRRVCTLRAKRLRICITATGSSRASRSSREVTGFTGNRIK